MTPKWKQIVATGAMGDVLRWDGSTWVMTASGCGDDAWYGDGSDGDVTISGNTTLTRDMLYNNLVINVGVVVTTDGFRVLVRGTLTNNGTIARNGITATSGVDAAGLNDDRPCSGSLGRETVTTYHGYLGGQGGDGGSGALGLGETSVALTTTCMSQPRALPLVPEPTQPLSTAARWYGGNGGGHGGNSGVTTGGGGGSGGGVLMIYARFIINDGVLEARGGNGIPGTTHPTNPATGGGGGGGGGGVVLVYQILTGTGTVSVAGGTGGAGANGGGTGAPGVAGRVIYVQN